MRNRKESPNTSVRLTVRQAIPARLRRGTISRCRAKYSSTMAGSTWTTVSWIQGAGGGDCALPIDAKQRVMKTINSLCAVCVSAVDFIRLAGYTLVVIFGAELFEQCYRLGKGGNSLDRTVGQIGNGLPASGHNRH